MAERSTAAVGVANESGQPPLAAKADNATADDATDLSETKDATQQTKTEETAPPPPESEDEEGSQSTEPPELHSGHKLAKRYRLEECVTRVDGFSSWRAVDEKLRRAVGIHILPADHTRARPVLAAARSAALLGDPRFVQVLDAVEENDVVYVIHEWLPDATDLTAVLAAGPLEAHDAYQMVSQVSQAMAAAHREGLAHLRLSPDCVLRTESGQYRIRGLAVAAALHGASSERPQREDTGAIGALLYASLTQRWPYPDDVYGLSGLPKDIGPVAPDQVRAGVHRGLSEVAMRALVNDGATASRELQPCATPEELAKAVAAIPRIRPPEPAAAPYQRTTYQQGAYRQPPARQVPPSSPPTAPLHTGPPPALPGRTGKALKWAVSSLLIAALGLGSWQLADSLMHRENQAKAGTPSASQSSGSTGGTDGTGNVALKTLPIKYATEFKPGGSGIQEDEVPLAYDGNSGTAWITPQYRSYSNFGNLSNRKQGSGIIVDLGSTRTVSRVQVQLYRTGQTVEVLAAGSSTSVPSQLTDFSQRITKSEKVGEVIDKTLTTPVKIRWVLIHITDLPTDGSPNLFRGGISEIKVAGKSE